MSNILRIGLAAAMAVLALAPPSWAQTNRIGGVVRDETGEAIRGVVVRATVGGVGSGGAPMSLTTATDNRGRFVFVISRSGEWRLAFEAPGFDATAIAVPLRLTGPAATLEIKMQRDEAPEAFGALAGVDSKALSAQLAAAAVLLDEGRHDQAIAAYRDILAKVPVLTLANLQIGNAYLAKRSHVEAETAFQEILKSDPADANALFGMGAVREAQGNSAEAQGWYQKASAADTLWTKPLMRLAVLARASGDRAAASRHLARVIDLDPASSDARQAADMQRDAP